MSSIADKLEEEAEFRRQMITALIYPSILLIMSLVVVMLLGIFIIPKFAPMLEGGGKTVPWATQLVMDISDWIQKHWVRVLQVIFGTVVGLFLFRRTDRGGYLVDLFLLRIPVVGKVVQSGSVIAFSNNLAMLYASGVPISDALQTVRDTLANSAAAKLVDRMVDSILSGGSLVEPLRKAEHIFPPMVAEMLATGEETGELERALLLLGKIFKTMLNSFVKQMNALIEPLMILILGGIVGFVFYALITGVLAVYGV
jgi:type II secretory pathway component PulF